ncbi:MerR family transcriptional regulator [Umezawaea endophytica]|uniref:MerR family transcriptional regulator n=1 Tax=Umezawaea endophytica TaxID=1654476 RepID=A0A9X3AEJ7_9PSEU|nr:MerR family transcriptional regulator [Umezawaea endophytica]MCS7477362.1 MerR family transcriptional regulator [Umezawaea endophytica]
MAVLLSIGEFATMTRLSRKALRHYHDVGVLEPAKIDPETGYRFYDTSQVRSAHLIRRFRELDMPVAEVKAVLEAPSESVRNEVIEAHLRRLEEQAERTREAIASLRVLLGSRSSDSSADPPIGFRSEPAVAAAAVTAVVGIDSVVEWWKGAVSEISTVLSGAGVTPSGVVGGLYSIELFSEEEGEASVFVPVDVVVPPVGRVHMVTVPAASLAVAVHSGPAEDQTYGQLGTFVAERGIGAAGPVREYYVEGGVEICWPVTSVASV